MSGSRDKRDSKKVHYSDKDRHDYQKHEYRSSRDSGIGSSTRASLETNENPFAPRSTESQRYDLRALQEAYDSALGKIGRLEDANAELDRMQKKASEERRTYKKDYEAMIVKNDKLIAKNTKLEEENADLKDRIERFEKREKEYRSGSSTTTASSTSRTSPSGGSSRRQEEDRTPRPPQVRIREPGEKRSSSRSRRSSFSAQAPLPTVPQPPPSPKHNPFFPAGSGIPVTRAMPLTTASYTSPHYVTSSAPQTANYVASSAPRNTGVPFNDGSYHRHPL